MNQTATPPIALPQELVDLLERQRARVRRRWLVHGLGIVLGLPLAACLFFFALDHVLRLPLAIRLLHTAAIAGLLGWTAWRFVKYPLSRSLSQQDTAILLEARFPELHQRLVSAVQLGGTATDGLRNQSQQMVRVLLDETMAAAKALPLHELFAPARTLRVWAGAAAVLLAATAGAVLQPATASAFVLRHLGMSVSYPRATNLQVELPPSGPDLHRVDDAASTTITMPAGGDLHVSVLAQGVVPEGVELMVTGQDGDERSIGTTPRPGGRFRHVFRRVTGSFTFHARGGDDEQGDRVVEVRTIHPPAVATIEARLTPPAYTGQDPVVQKGGAVEALVGTTVELQVTATAPVRSATAVFLEGGRRLELQPAAVADDSGTSPTFTGRFVVETPDRYQVELLGDNGLRNPDPGSYPVAALQDYSPVGRWLQPDDEGSAVLLPTATLCVRYAAKDDFGLAKAELLVELPGGREQRIALLQPVAAGTRAPLEAAGLRLLRLTDLLGEARSAQEGLALQVLLEDNKAPAANATQLPRRSIQVVDAAQLAAAIARHFRSLREEVTQALEIQEDRRARIAELQQDNPSPSQTVAQALTAVEVGQGRVQTAADRSHRQLMRAFDMHLWNGLETSNHAPKVVELYTSWHEARPEAPANDPAFHRELARQRREGTIGALELVLDPILGMVLLADSLATDLGPRAARLLAEAQVAQDAAGLRQALDGIAAVQDQAITALTQLRDRLEEWNDYQDLIQEARALRDRQRDVQLRTEELKGRK